MPDLKDRNTRLNPSQKDFDDLVSRPDMQALNDQGDSITRDHKQPSADPDKIGGPVKNAKDVASAEDKPASPSLYKPSEKTQSKGFLSRFAPKSNRQRVVAGGAVAGVALSIAAGILALLPMKIIGIMDTIISDTGQRVEQVTERRAKTIVARAILTKFGARTGVVVTGEGAFSSLIASMRTSGFEKKLAAKGMVIESTPDGVKLKSKGHYLSVTKSNTVKFILTSEMEVIQALDGSPHGRKLLKEVVKEEIPSWRWMKRAKFAKWLRYKYDIPRFGILNDSNETDDDKRASVMQKARLKLAYERLSKNATSAFDCLLGSSCVADNLGDSTKGELKESPDKGELTADIQEAGNTLAEKGSADPGKQVTEKLTTEVVNKLGTKAIPVIGWIDLVATLDHVAHNALENDYFSKIPAYFRSLQYAQLFGEWGGYSDQQKLGALDHAMNGPLAKQLDGAETSQAFNYIEGDPTKGKPVKLKINSNNPSKYKEFWEDYKNTLGKIPGAPLGETSHFFLNVYYETIGSGGLLGIAGEFFGDAIAAVAGPLVGFFTPDSLQEWFFNAVKTSIGKVMDYVGLTIDPQDAGADLFNNLHAGGTVSFNDYCREIGCRKLNSEQANISNQTIAYERHEDVADKGFFYALFSPNNTESLTTKLAISLPTPSTSSAGEILGTLGSFVVSSPLNVISNTIPGVKADTKYVDLYGVNPYGATESDLNEPLSDAFLTGESCPEKADGEFNSCLIDTKVAEAMICEFDSESTECSDTDAASLSATGNGAAFRVSSFNIYYSSDDGKSYSTEMWEERLRRSSAVIRNNHLDVVGLQEVRQNQWQRIQDQDMLGSSYDIYPKNYQAGGYGSQNPIVWDRAKFQLVEGKSIPGYQVGGIKDNQANTQVKLKYIETGQEFYLINHHEPVGNVRDGTDRIEARYKSATERAAYVKDLQAKDGLPVFMTGDFNSGYFNRPQQQTYQDNRNNLAYCIFTADNLLWDALDASKNNKGACPTTEAPGVDHIFMSTNVTAKNYDYSISPRGNGSDVHNTLFVDVEIPGTGSSQSGEWAWPVDKKWWDTNRADMVGAHTADSGTWTNGINRLAVDIGDPPDGSPVYAMLGGDVVLPDLGGHGLIIKSKVPEGYVYIAYAHGPRTNQKTSYAAGEKIMEIGCLGNCDGGHLHLDMSLGKTGELKNDKSPICPQDIFLAMSEGKNPDLGTLTKKAVAPCGRL